MTGYETLYILRPSLSEPEANKLKEKIEGIIKKHEGKLVAWDDWGRRKLAYPIAKETRGRYMYLAYTSNNTGVAEVERNLKLAEAVIRYMSVKLSDEFDEKEFMKKFEGKSLLEKKREAVPRAEAAAE